jgi:hypothetical protein
VDDDDVAMVPLAPSSVALARVRQKMAELNRKFGDIAARARSPLACSEKSTPEGAPFFCVS